MLRFLNETTPEQTTGSVGSLVRCPLVTTIALNSPQRLKSAICWLEVPKHSPQVPIQLVDHSLFRVRRRI